MHRPLLLSPQNRVGVHVPQARDHGLPGGVDDGGVGVGLQRISRPDGDDAVTLNDHGRPGHEDPAFTVKEVAVPDHQHSGDLAGEAARRLRGAA